MEAGIKFGPRASVGGPVGGPAGVGGRASRQGPGVGPQGGSRVPEARGWDQASGHLQ